MNLSDAIEVNARRRPDHPAIVESNGEITTYREYENAVRRWASVLRNMEIGSGDIVGLNLKDTPDHLIALYAIARSGAAVLPMDWRWTDEEKTRIADFFGARAVFSEPDDTFLSVTGRWSDIAVDEDWRRHAARIEAQCEFPDGENQPPCWRCHRARPERPKAR